MADIDLGGNEENQWMPIGNSSSKSLKGTFDGSGHRITGLYISNTKEEQGLFGYVNKDGTVKNLSICGTVMGTPRSGPGDKLGEAQVCYHESEKLSTWLWNNPIYNSLIALFFPNMVRTRCLAST